MAETTYSLQNRNEAVNALYESVDGLNWQAISSPHVPRIRSMAKSRDWLIAVGDKGTVLRQPLNP